MLENGRGTPQDYEESIKWYTLSAERGHVNAQYKLGLMYLKGLGVAQSPVNAYAWWIVAASQGHEEAQKYMASAKQQMDPKEIERAQQIAKQLWTGLYKLPSSVLKDH